MGRPTEARRLALEVTNLSVGFERTTVINRLSFDVLQGSALAIIGPNGAGKSVLVKALIGVQASDGTISWEANTRIGYVPQKLDIERDLPITGVDFLHAKAAVVHAPAGAVADTGHVSVVRAAPSARLDDRTRRRGLLRAEPPRWGG